MAVGLEEDKVSGLCEKNIGAVRREKVLFDGVWILCCDMLFHRSWTCWDLQIPKGNGICRILCVIDIQSQKYFLINH